MVQLECPRHPNPSASHFVLEFFISLTNVLMTGKSPREPPMKGYPEEELRQRRLNLTIFFTAYGVAFTIVILRGTIAVLVALVISELLLVLAFASKKV